MEDNRTVSDQETLNFTGMDIAQVTEESEQVPADAPSGLPEATPIRLMPHPTQTFASGTGDVDDGSVEGMPSVTPGVPSEELVETDVPETETVPADSTATPDVTGEPAPTEEQGTETEAAPETTESVPW